MVSLIWIVCWSLPVIHSTAFPVRRLVYANSLADILMCLKCTKIVTTNSPKEFNMKNQNMIAQKTSLASYEGLNSY